jgi:hypothetical protein
MESEDDGAVGFTDIASFFGILLERNGARQVLATLPIYPARFAGE